jgi:hypothetical protein
MAPADDSGALLAWEVREAEPPYVPAQILFFFVFSPPAVWCARVVLAEWAWGCDHAFAFRAPWALLVG